MNRAQAVPALSDDAKPAVHGPELVTDPDTLEAIYRLRAAIWRETADVAQSAFADGTWSDEHDPGSLHWVMRDGRQLVGAARLSIHQRLADVPEAGEYAAAGLRLQGSIAAPARVVVAAAARGRGLAGQLLDAQDAAALAAGARYAVRQASPAMCRLLRRRGWRDVGPAGRDERFPGVRFEVMMFELIP